MNWWKMDATDMQLLSAYRECRSEEAFRTLVERHIHWVHSAALRRVRDAHMADDVTQTVFVILARKADDIGSGVLLTGWLFRTLQHAASTALRSELRRQRREQLAMEPESASESPWFAVEPLLEEELARLRAADRDAILLHYFQRKSLRDVGAALGISEDGAQKRVSRAVERLRGSLVRRGCTLSTVVLGSMLLAHATQAAPAGLSASVAASCLGASAPGAFPLVSSTLKLMAATKTKTTLLVVALSLLALGSSVLVLTPFLRGRFGGPDLTGAWEGVLRGGPTEVRVVVWLTRQPGGLYTGTLDSVGQGIRGVPLSQIESRPGRGHFEAKGIGGVYEGTVSADARRWEGTWSQLGNRLPLELTRTTNPTPIAASVVPTTAPPGAPPSVEGYWKGVIAAGQIRLRVAFRIARDPDGTYRASMDSLDQGSHDVPVSSVSFSRPHVEIEVNGVGGFYEGTLDATATRIDGKWTQAGRPLDLVLERGEPEKEPADQGSTVSAGDTDPAGHWAGSLKIGAVALRLELTFLRQADGSYKALLDSPDQGAHGIPATRVTVNAPLCRVEFKGIGGVYEGNLKGGSLEGTWQQGPTKNPLKLARSKSP